MVLSENWKRLKGIFFFKYHHFYEIVEIFFFENFPSAFFNILKEQLLVQKQTIHQQKALDPRIPALIWHSKSGRGMIRRPPHPLAAKSIGAREAKKDLLQQVIVTPS